MSQHALPCLSRRAFALGAAATGIGATVRPPTIAADLLPRAPRRHRALAAQAGATPDQRPEAPDSTVVTVSPALGLQYTQPAIATDPRDAQRLLAVCRRTAPTPKQPPVVAAFNSADGGRTWQEAGPLALPAGLTVGSDATVSFDSEGSGYVAALVAADQAMATSQVVVWRTDDGGQSFGPATTVAEGSQIDHPWLAANPAAGGHVSVTWASQAHGLMVSVSSDGGHTFEPARTIVSPAGGAIITPVLAAAGGIVLVAYGIAAATSPATPNGAAPSDLTPISLAVTRSTDGGGHFGPAVVVGPMAPAVAPGPEFRVQTGPAVAIDSAGQRVYVAAASFDPATGKSAIQVAGSSDGGATFGSLTPVTGDETLEGTVYAQPSIVVDGTGGINVTYIAVDAAQPQIVYDVFLTRSTDRGATFGRRQRLSDHSRGFAVEGTDANGLYHWLGGDYQGLAVGDGTIHPIWGDPVAGIVTTAKTFAND